MRPEIKPASDAAGEKISREGHQGNANAYI